MTPPVDHLQTALPNLDLSTFLASIFSTTLANEIKSQPRTTLLVPHNRAFARLGGLVSDYLLRASSRIDLERIILHHTINGVEYAQTLLNGSAQTYPTLEGSDVHIDRFPNGSIILNPSGGWAGMTTAANPVNLLSKTGVIHELSDIMIPRSVDINVGKLARAGKATTMLSILTRAGFDWIMNGTAPPDGTPWADKGLTGTGWTLLCPTDDSFESENLTELYSDNGRMVEIVSQHLVQSASASVALVAPDMLNNNRPLLLKDLATYPTLLSSDRSYDTRGDVVIREQRKPDGTGSEYIVGINNARGGDGGKYSARVLSWGRATTGTGSGGVILVDGLLYPYHPPWYIEYGAPIVVGIFGGFLIVFFFWKVWRFWQRDTREATYEPIGSAFAGDDD